MRGSIEATLSLAREVDGYQVFRERYYAQRLLPGIAMPDSRETVPVALSLLYLAGGDPRQAILYGANFGRDADTIASMAGAVAGAFRGATAFPPPWLAKLTAESPRAHQDVARQLTDVILKRSRDAADSAAAPIECTVPRKHTAAH